MTGVTDHGRERLAELARRTGVATSYVGWDTDTHEVSDETLIAVLGALGVDAGDDERIGQALAELDVAPWRAFVPPVTVVTEHDDAWFWIHVPHGDPVDVRIRTEGGELRDAHQLDHWWDPRDVDGTLVGRATFAVPGDLEPGYHTIEATDPGRGGTASAPLIVTPRRLSTADDLLGSQRWGIATQLYSVRSAGSWGIGDFADLAAMAEIAGATHGADFIQVNPLHAAQPRPPVEASPYLPPPAGSSTRSICASPTFPSWPNSPTTSGRASAGSRRSSSPRTPLPKRSSATRRSVPNSPLSS